MTWVVEGGETVKGMFLLSERIEIMLFDKIKTFHWVVSGKILIKVVKCHEMKDYDITESEVCKTALD